MTTYTDQILFQKNGIVQQAHSSDTIQVSSNLSVSNKFTTSSGINVKLASKTASYAITTSDYIISIGTITSSVTITLPASPSNGDVYTVVDANGSAAAHNIVVSGNGNNIAGNSTYTIAINYESVTVVFDSTNTTWVII